MNFLFETYGVLYPMIWVGDSQGRMKHWNPSLEDEMFVMAVMTVLCTAAVAFCVRVLVALCRESKPRRINYWVLLEPGNQTIAEPQHRNKPTTFAA
jgi:hypothetical protein